MAPLRCLNLSFNPLSTEGRDAVQLAARELRSLETLHVALEEVTVAGDVVNH
jgi:hypothetical protein